MTTIDQWREPQTRCVGLVISPGNHSLENGILTTVMAWVMKLIPQIDATDVIDQYRDPRGFFVRYPGSFDLMSHDDLTAAAWVSRRYAEAICSYGEVNGWTWPGVGNLSRIWDFAPAIRAAAGDRLTLSDQLNCVLAWLWNAFRSPYSDTSGKQLIFLKIRMTSGKGLISDFAAAIWNWRMRRLYGTAGLREMLSIWYGSDPSGEVHPIVRAAPVEFG